MLVNFTDSPTEYDSLDSGPKVLLEGGLPSRCSWLGETATAALLDRLIGLEYEAKAAMHDDLYARVERLSGRPLAANKYLRTRSDWDIAHFYLHLNFNTFIAPSYQAIFAIRRILEEFPGMFDEARISLPDDYRYCEELGPRYLSRISHRFNFRTTPARRPNKVAKFLYHLFHRAVQPLAHPVVACGDEKTHLLVVLYNLAHHQDLLMPFLRIVRGRPDLHVSVVHVSWGGDEKHNASLRHMAGDNIRVYDLKDFRSPAVGGHRDFYDAASALSPSFARFKDHDLLYNADLGYAWMGRAFERLKPDVCLHTGMFNDGRYMSDVARFHGVPSIYIEYSLAYADDFQMESNIEFTVRGCIGPDAINQWKLRRDPSLNFECIGFCKLDAAEEMTRSLDRPGFLSGLGLDPARKTVFFASTYALSNINLVYDVEKKRVVEDLSEVAHRNGWNLLIKKHPLEFDRGVNAVLASRGHPFQRAFEHTELDLCRAIFASDIVTNQYSSIVMEAMFFDKPFCYLTTSQDAAQADHMGLVRGGTVPKFSSIEAFESFARDVFTDEGLRRWREKIQPFKAKYLYKTDGKASERLLDLVLRLAARDPGFRYAP